MHGVRIDYKPAGTYGASEKFFNFPAPCLDALKKWQAHYKRHAFKLGGRQTNY